MTTETNYCTLAYAKEVIEPEITDSGDDTRIENLIGVSSRSIDTEANRFFYQTEAGTELVVEPGASPYELYVGHDIVSLTEVAIDWDRDGTYEETWAGTDWELEPYDAALQSKPYWQVHAIGDYLFPRRGLIRPIPRIKLTGTFGWPAVPEPIQHAAAMLTIRLLKRATSPLGIAGFSPEVPVYVRNTDPDIARMVHPYRRMPIL